MSAMVQPQSSRTPRHRRLRYEGEDVSPTTSRELRGFYAYGLAAEIFAVCGVGSFLPVTLEQLARERGVLWSDRTTSCMQKVVNNATEIAVNSTSVVLARADKDKNNQCIVSVFGTEVTTSSFAMYTFSMAVFVQALALISFSSVADYGSYRKKLLLGFGFTGATTSMLFIFVVPQIFLVGPLLVIIGVTCLGSSFVVLNSFLPVLVANHPEVQHTESDAYTIPLQPISRIAQEQHLDSDIKVLDSPSLRISNKISSKGVGIGYMAAVCVQILSILLLFILSKNKNISSTLPLRLVLCMVGVFWFGFTIPASTWLRSRPGPPLPSHTTSTSRIQGIYRYTLFAWKSLFQTVKTAFKLRQIVLFLVAWFLLSDAIATVSGTAILFARTELKLGTVAVACLSITATVSGIAGAFLWPMISRGFNLPTKNVIIACIIAMEIIPIYGLLGFIPFIQDLGVGGIQRPWEIFPLGIVHGFVMGGISSYCRAFYGRLIPSGREAAFYALYAVTDKGSSAIGPAVVGVIVDRTGTIRGAFVFLAILVLLPAPLVWAIDVEKGVEDAERMAGGNGKSDSGDEETSLGSDEEWEGSGDEDERLMTGHT
ncbi:hypothetical protein HYALB_00001154 [Hymenoscyphus albidus]|uniref:Autophagy-related protein n=1 Tax=Hymenoscyphus albidus TaxID=595503 RepID=A0A9N9PY65_9HELO|nr:hypothetical protein HYALB_00001154 [Hymenoscyphus albidus]